MRRTAVRRFPALFMAITVGLSSLFGNPGGLCEGNIKTVKAEGYYKDPEEVPVIMLDPGHDSIHCGTHEGGMQEEILNLKIARYCRDALLPYEVKVYMTRDGYSCPHPESTRSADNVRRAYDAAAVEADLYVALHLNSDLYGRASGAEVYYPNKSYRPDLSVIGKGVADAIMKELVKLGLRNNGVQIRNTTIGEKYDDGSVMDYYQLIIVPKLLGIPAIIVEHCYQSNAGDRRFLDSEADLKALGEADAKGMIAYFGLQKKTYAGAFDAGYYAANNPDLAAAFGNNEEKLLNHYLTYGLPEGRIASPVFDINYYKTSNPDLASQYGSDLKGLAEHFIHTGMAEGRQGNATFNVYYYRTRNSDLKNAFEGDLKAYYLHYVNYGYAEGRKATPETDVDEEGNPGHYAEYQRCEKPDEISMYRVYNPRTGEHLYTENTGECEAVQSTGWFYENVAWNEPLQSEIPVYRVYNPTNGDHHYTTDTYEVANLVSSGWRDEGIAWYSDTMQGTPVYRLYNPNAKAAGSHHYTASAAERDMLTQNGWSDEGIMCFGTVE